MPLTFPPVAATASITDLAVIPGFNPLNRLSPARTDVEYQSSNGNFLQAFPSAGGAGAVICLRSAGESGILTGIQMSIVAGEAGFDGRLRIFVDQEVIAGFDVDLGTLFVSHNEAHTGPGQSVGTNHIQMDVVGGSSAWVDGGGNSNMVSYQMLYPVPYSNGVRVEVYTPAGITVPGGSVIYSMVYRRGQTSTMRLRSVGVTRLEAAAAAVNMAAADIPLFDLPNNYGWMVYWGMACFGASNYSYLERPYFWYIDGESTASFVKTGGEEYGATGWFFGLNGRLTQPAVIVTSSNNASRQMTVGYDILQMHGGIRFTNELRMVWGNKPATPATSNHKFGWCALYYVDTAVPFVPTAARSVSGTTLGSGQAAISWAAPLSTGSSPILGYTVTLSPGGATFSAAAEVLAHTFSGLTNGTAYTPSVTANNSVGSSTAANGSAVTPIAGATVPGAPAIGTAVAGSGSASVPFTAPGSNGGSVITGYLATSTPGSFTGSVSGAGSGTITVSGLLNGTAYTFTVHATNAIGNSTESAASNSVTPANAAYSISDDFNRADAATLGVTPVGAKTWNTFSTGTPLVGIAGNCGFVNSSSQSNSYAYVVSASADIDVTATLAVIGSDPNYAGVIARVVDRENMVVLQYDASGPTATAYSVYKEIAGAYTLLGSTTGITPAAGDVLRLKVTGTNTVDCYVNGTHFGPYTATGISASSINAGLQGASIAAASTARFDNFSVA